MTLDHLILAGPDLSELQRLVLERTGVAPRPGGRHLGHGTHNALVGLGPGCYLEVLAPDPEQDGGAFRDAIAHLHEPALHTWCVRAGPAAEAVTLVTAAHLVPRRVPMQRRRADGGVLAWELVFADGHPYGPLVPFFIDWQGAEHPSARLSAPLRLTELTLAHPDAAGLRQLLTRLGGVPEPVQVRSAGRASLGATLRHDGGTWRVPEPRRAN